MTNGKVQLVLWVSGEVATTLDDMARSSVAGAIGSKATRHSVARALIERSLEAMKSSLPGTPVASYGAPPVPVMAATPRERIDAAMRATGAKSLAAVDAALGLARGTTGLAHKGGCALDKAGGGALLAWVEATEAGGAT
jgi:molybdopterin-biosynthesis enzyme MoeA-like protein